MFSCCPQARGSYRAPPKRDGRLTSVQAHHASLGLGWQEQMSGSASSLPTCLADPCHCDCGDRIGRVITMPEQVGGEERGIS